MNGFWTIAPQSRDNESAIDLKQIALAVHSHHWTCAPSCFPFCDLEFSSRLSHRESDCFPNTCILQSPHIKFSLKNINSGPLSEYFPFCTTSWDSRALSGNSLNRDTLVGGSPPTTGCRRAHGRRSSLFLSSKPPQQTQVIPQVQTVLNKKR